MTQQSPRPLALALLAWLGVGLFWFAVTRKYHPTLDLAVIVTTSLIAAYALASTINLWVLVPRFWRPRRYLAYAGRLSALMAALTALALLVIRISYYRAVGPDPDPNGLYKHYAIDLAGMVVHVAIAAGIARLFRR